jgi:hypothetical protein
MIPFQHVHDRHAQSADELVELLAPRRFDVVGQVVAIVRFEAAFAKKARLLRQPAIKVALVFGADRLIGLRLLLGP